MARIWIIEDDEIMAECLATAVNLKLSKPKSNIQPKHEIKHFTNVINAISALNTELPDLIILDILLSGPDGLSFLNELISYPDTMKIPIIIVSSLELSAENFSEYNIVQIFQKETMTPQALNLAVKEVLSHA